MSLQSIISLVITLTAASSYLNYRFLKLPSGIGIMLMALILSLIVIILDKLNIQFGHSAQLILNSVNFTQTFLDGMISFLLFAGALHINVADLAKQKWMVGVLATVSVIISTLIVGYAFYFIANLFKFDFRLIHCLIFGALIAPTDPIIILNSLKSLSFPKRLKIKIAGESLFNDGIGIVLFSVLLTLSTDSQAITLSHAFVLFIQITCGGVVLGLILGYFVSNLLVKVNNLEVAILITLSLVTGGYQLTSWLHVSGPIAIVIAGLMVGEKLRTFKTSTKMLGMLDGFWSMTDEILNSLLFLLVGLEILDLNLTFSGIFVALLAIPIVLIARYISIAIPILASRAFRSYSSETIAIMTWGGLRGGVSIALALSMPSGPVRNEILTMTYLMVIFSIVVQGLTLSKLFQYFENKKTLKAEPKQISPDNL